VYIMITSVVGVLLIHVHIYFLWLNFAFLFITRINY